MKCNRSLKHQIDDCGRCNLLWIGCQERAADLTAMKKTLCPSWTLRTFLNSVLNTPRTIDICGLFLDSCCIWQLSCQLCMQTCAAGGHHRPLKSVSDPNPQESEESQESSRCHWKMLKDLESIWKYLKLQLHDHVAWCTLCLKGPKSTSRMSSGLYSGLATRKQQLECKVLNDSGSVRSAFVWNRLWYAPKSSLYCPAHIKKRTKPSIPQSVQWNQLKITTIMSCRISEQVGETQTTLTEWRAAFRTWWNRKVAIAIIVTCITPQHSRCKGASSPPSESFFNKLLE